MDNWEDFESWQKGAALCEDCTRKLGEAHDRTAARKEARLNQIIEDLDETGFCPVCSLEQKRNVPIPMDGTCSCGGFENVGLDHDVEMMKTAAKGECYFCRPVRKMVNGACPKCKWRPVVP